MIINRNNFSKSSKIFFLLLLTLAFILAACGPAEEENNNSNDNGSTTIPSQEGYPVETMVQDGSYPSPLDASGGEAFDSSYPPPVASDKPLFALDLPLTAGDTTVSGQSPESLPLAIVDVTFGGVILGTGVSDDDGRFSIPVTALTEGHRVGVTITEIEPGITFEEIAEQYFPYRGEGFMNTPNVGIFYDSVIVEP
jgi:hypothetical protein